MYPPLRRYRLFVIVAVVFISVFLVLQSHLRPDATVVASSGFNPASSVSEDPAGGARQPSRASFDFYPSVEHDHGQQDFPKIELPGDDQLHQADHFAVHPPSDNSVIPQRPEFLPKHAPGQLKDSKIVHNDAVEIVEIAPSYTPPHWSSQTQHFPVPSTAIIPLPTGKPKVIPRIQATASGTPDAQADRLRAIRDVYKKHWSGYEKFAWEHDELKPVSGGYSDPFAGWRATLVDSLDTLWIMGLKDEFIRAVDATKSVDFTTTSRQTLPLFEVVIRYLGGLLGGYDVSGQKFAVLLDKAEELAEVLMGAFDTPNRMPLTHFDWMPSANKQPRKAPIQVVMAELGSLSLEFTRLAQLTKKNKYYDAIARITNELEAMQRNTTLPGLWPLMIDTSGGCQLDLELLNQHSLSRGPSGTISGQPAAQLPPRDFISPSVLHGPAQVQGLEGLAGPPANKPMDKCVKTGLTSAVGLHGSKFTLGGMADSTYEYLPKEHLLLGGLNGQYQSMHEYSTKVWKQYLLFKPMIKDTDRQILFTGEWQASGHINETTGRDTGSLKPSSGHLTCFLGAYLGLGAKAFGIKEDMDIAARLTDGCVWAYEQTASGIMPENFDLTPCPSIDGLCPWNETRWWEAVDPYAEAKVEWNINRQQKSAKATQPIKLPSLEDLAEESSLDQAGAGPKSKRQAASFPQPSLHSSQSHLPTKVTPDSASHVAADAMDFTTPTTVAELMEMSLRVNPTPRGFARIASREYMLRPEAIESVFYMWRLTGDSYWREKGWKMFEAIDKATTAEYGNSAILDVMTDQPTLRDSAESFWTAETLKYFYLLFSDTDLVSLDDYVLNTEAHPFRRPDAGPA